MLTAEAVLVAIFAACSVWLAISSPTETPMITPPVRAVFTWYSIVYSARVLLGYLLIGLVLGSCTWAALASWSLLVHRPMTPRRATAGTLLVLAAMLIYKAISLCVMNPLVAVNAVVSPGAVWLIGVIGDMVPAWLLATIRALALATLCVLLVAGSASALRRVERRLRVAVLIVASALLMTVAGLGLGLSLGHLPAKSGHPDRPNILILATDGLQKEHLGLYGYGRPTSPNIDRLGAQSVRFTNVYVPLARTLQSWTSMLTGTWPHTHGLRTTWTSAPHIDMKLPTLCRELARQGYRSCVFSDWAGSDFGKVDYGFDVTETSPEAWSLSSWIGQATCRAHPLLVSFGDNWLGHKMFPEMKGMPVSPSPESVTARAIGSLETFAHARQPFFMIVFYSETHLPYATRYPYYRVFADPSYEGVHKASVYLPDPRLVASGGVDPERHFDTKQLRALYDGAVLSFDDQVGTIVSTLKDLNLWDETIVVIASDHGEDLLETPKSYGHGHSLYGDDYDNRIPLVVSDPALRGRGPREVDTLLSSIDLMPTLLERVGQTTPATCEGESFLDLLRGDEAPREHRSEVFCETGVMMGGGRELQDDRLLVYPPLLEMMEVSDLATGQVGIRPDCRDLLIEARQRMIRTPEWKLLYTPLKEGAEYQLFDVQADPACLHDMTSERPDVASRLKERLWQWMGRDRQRWRRGDHLVRRPEAGPAE